MATASAAYLLFSAENFKRRIFTMVEFLEKAKLILQDILYWAFKLLSDLGYDVPEVEKPDLGE